MRLIAYRHDDRDRVALRSDHGAIDLTALAHAAGAEAPATVEEAVTGQRLDEIRAWSERVDLTALPVLPAGLAPAPLLRRPPKILGVGLNYAEHAGDLGETRPDEPATFMKPATTIIGAGETIRIPRQSARTTGEAELGLVVGRPCKDVDAADAPAVLAGVTTILDMTAEDILQRNPRFLTRAKSFDTFLVLGPELVSVDELGPIGEVEVTTVHGGQPARRNVVANMLHDPWSLVAFFSAVMPLEPGDVITTGTPGAVVLRDGDVVGCSIPGVGEIACPVTDAARRSDA
jgi:2-keto-4-pentenoate hydratase/2-oxohepta-3-ene-1,7-dioic acid hydratase in catechol pathway